MSDRNYNFNALLKKKKKEPAAKDKSQPNNCQADNLIPLLS